MASERMYFDIFLSIPIILAVIPAAIVLYAVVFCHVLTPAKVVRIMFPYIRRSGNNTVAFGFILTDWQIFSLFSIVYYIILYIILTFWANILIMYTNNNNLFSATSIDLECFYYDNGTIIANLTAIERLELDEDITCYAINFNIAGAAGQATGALALGWVITSIVTWIALNVNYCIIQRVKNNKRKLICYKRFLIIIICIIIILAVGSFYIILGLSDMYDINIKWLLYLIKPENITILVIISAVLCICMVTATDIKKEPTCTYKSLEERCRETMKTIQAIEMNRHRDSNERTQSIKQSILEEIVKQECRRMIAYETAIEITNNNEIKNILHREYIKIMEDREEEPMTNGPIENNDNTSSSNEERNDPETEHNPQDTQDIPLLPIEHMQ